MSRFASFWADRLGWEKHLKPFLYKPLPGPLNWSFTLGSLLMLLFVTQVVTGILLAAYYNPSPDHAYQSIGYIMNSVAGGSLIRGLHHYGAAAMVILVAAHLLANLYYGAYKPPRELTWVGGVFLLLMVLGFGFTGYLLPWDQKAYWATVVGTNVAGDVPLIGSFMAGLLRGGPNVSGLTLTRFYSIHVLLLPALTALLIVFHMYMVRLHDISFHEPAGEKDKDRAYLFFPNHSLKAALGFLVVLAVLIALSLASPPTQEAVARTPDPTYLPRPEWYYMWLFKLLTYFEGSTEVVGSLVIPLGLLALLVGLPFMSKSTSQAPSTRPLVLACAAACLVSVVYLTAMGMAESKPYGQVVALPVAKLSPQAVKGLHLWVEKDCAYCHQIMGQGGHRVGPDMSNILAKGRDRKYLVEFIRDPQKAKPLSIMPKYDLTPQQLEELASFLLSLDFEGRATKILTRKEALALTP
ncbi:MAG: cytochrome b N-terminal domain-containing protein [Desulfarculaceae bacterium]|nr:cytochrome b N-terminal domain-containing protein [Desulfarculaceae bacterium]MCF8046770.1 cytochrome b N-terminal domain-containing protein [Desulfarculaceae bacterium]MCF8099013.1 cytochrome b N-terminal domain-containing protein [Desulfarculaceae bacterium]MCF8124548.1 cytochrome b N-terminal domain-containing protein [Desulfarculaceae bacterium]